MTEPTLLHSRLREAAEAFLALREGVLAGEPWPLATDFGTEPEADWGPPEVLAHVTEMLPYWLGEMERILASRDPAPFGRLASDDVRLAIIGRDRTVPARELFDRVEADVARLEHRLAHLSAADLARKGLNPVRGPMAVQDVLGRFVVDHLADHAEQLRDALARRPG